MTTTEDGARIAGSSSLKMRKDRKDREVTAENATVVDRAYAWSHVEAAVWAVNRAAAEQPDLHDVAHRLERYIEAYAKLDGNIPRATAWSLVAEAQEALLEAARSHPTTASLVIQLDTALRYYRVIGGSPSRAPGVGGLT